MRLLERTMSPRVTPVGIGVILASAVACGVVDAQGLDIRHGSQVSREVRDLYDAGLRYLVSTQQGDGSWRSSYSNGPGIAGICCMALLSCGEDPNYGAYAEPLRKGLRFILRKQNRRTGFFSAGRSHGSMYEHGFTTLALAEAYGTVDDDLLWAGTDDKDPPTIGAGLELAVRCTLTSQNRNPLKAWRYSPTADDADTSVSGALLMALLAARNAGIEVPDANIEKALEYYARSTTSDGSVSYSGGFGGGGSQALTAISCLVHAIARKKDSKTFRSTLANLQKGGSLGGIGGGYPYYTRYYVAQALFQGDFEAWSRWNEANTEQLRDQPRDDGAIGADAYTTGMSLLSMALNFRFLPIYER